MILAVLSALQCVTPVDSAKKEQVSLSQSLVTISDSVLRSGTSATVSLRVRDDNGSDIAPAGQIVMFSLDDGTSTGDLEAATGGADGVYSARLTGRLAGEPVKVHASVNGAPVTSSAPSVRVVPGDPSVSQSRVTAEREEVAAGNSIWLQLEPRDEAGNRVTEGDLEVAFSAGEGSSTGTIGAVTRQPNGLYRSTFTGRNTGTPLTIAASIGGRAVTSALPTLRVVPGSIASSSVLTVSSGTVASLSSATLMLQGKDAAGNNLTSGGLRVLFTHTGSPDAGTIGATVDHGNGSYSAVFSARLAGSLTIGAVVDDQPVTSDRPTLTVVPGPPSPSNSQIEVSPTEVSVGETATIRLTTRDAVGNSSGRGLNVAFQVTGGDAGTLGAVTDRGDGSYTAVFQATAPGSVSFGAEIGGTAVAGRPFLLVKPGSPPAYPSHAPPGWTVNTAWDMSQNPAPGWRVLDFTPAGEQGGTFSITSDPGSPGTAPRVGQWSFASGFSGTGMTLYYDTPRETEIYVAWWWKAGSTPIHMLGGDGYQMTFGVEPFRDAGGRDLLVAKITTQCCDNSSLPNSWGTPTSRYLGGNVNGGNYVYTPGTWYRIEFYIKANESDPASERPHASDTPTGVIRWWVNGTAVGDYATVRTGPLMGFEAISFSTGVSPGTEDVERIDDILVMVPPHSPGTVRDLSVVESFSNAVLLQFISVTDGHNNPASYEIRHAPPPIAWGSAHRVFEGSSTLSGRTPSCRSGFTPQARTIVRCYVVGLEPGTSYELQLVAYRGTPESGITYGGLSNIAAATTAATASDIGAVTNLLAVPAPVSGQATVVFDMAGGGSGQPLRYELRYAAGDISWGNAVPVSRGTCTDLAEGPFGSSDTRVACSVDGLTPGTRYQFQLVAYRGTLDGAATFGPLSNVAEAVAP